MYACVYVRMYACVCVCMREEEAREWRDDRDAYCMSREKKGVNDEAMKRATSLLTAIVIKTTRVFRIPEHARGHRGGDHHHHRHRRRCRCRRRRPRRRRRRPPLPPPLIESPAFSAGARRVTRLFCGEAASYSAGGA